MSRLSTRKPRLPLRRGAGGRVLAALVGMLAFAVVAAADGAAPRPAAESSGRVLKNFDEIWALSEAEQSATHRVRFEYLVYYYDPLWMALWGRCGEADSYLSLGTKRFPIKPGQRILVEGVMQPSHGMRVNDAEVTVLGEGVPIEELDTKGQVGRTELFNKRVVAMEAYVDSQVARDANHIEMRLITEGRLILGQLVVSAEQPVPQLMGSVIRARGVYFARAEPQPTGPRIELWVQRAEDIRVLTTLDRDPRFFEPAMPGAKVADLPAGSGVHVSGTVESFQPGKSVALRLGDVRLQVETLQTLALGAGDTVEAVGVLGRDTGAPVLREALVRTAQPVLTSVADVWGLSGADRQRRYRVRLNLLVYFFDPAWKALWGRCGDSDEYVSLGDKSFPIQSGQRVLIEGVVLPANGMMVEEPKVTVLDPAEPLEALSTRGEVGNVERFQKRFVALEGHVDRQQSSDATHVHLDLVTEGRMVIGRVLLPPGTVVPNWTDALVRLRGVYSATQDPTGSMPTIEIWTPGLANVEVLGSLATDERFRMPATAIEKISALPAGTWVHVAGIARGQQPGRQLYLRDETGQIVLQSAQTRPVALGDAVEAIGVVFHDPAETQLRQVLFRKTNRPAPMPTGALPKIRLADQLREMEPEEAAKAYPVQLSGVVTWARPNADFFYVRDSSGGVRVYRPPNVTTTAVFVGTKVEITGVSSPGKFTPVVLASSVQAFSSIELPEPRPVTLEQALTGVEEGQWVSMSGFVRAVGVEEPWTRLDLTTSAGEFSAMLAKSDRWAKLPGSVVRIRGVCAAEANEKRQLTGIKVWVPTSRFVEIEEEAPADPFVTASRSIASLRQFSSLQALNRRVRVAGVVVHQTPGRLVHIQEGADGLLVLSRSTTPLKPGDRIEAVGFPGRENSRVVLREAIYRSVSSGPEPQPVALGGLSPISPELDGRLVRVEGTLLDISSHEAGVRLLVQSHETIAEALLDRADKSAARPWAPKSRVALTGVYVIRFDEDRRPHGVVLQLRSARDVVVLKAAPWWTLQLALGATGVLAVGLLLGTGWVLVLRRRVQHQTGVIREQEESERAARLEAALARASKLESLGVLAGGIAHDFNNLLTVVLGNISLAKLDARAQPETLQWLSESERAATRARDLTQQLLTFAKGGEPIKSSARLPDIVREAAQFGLHGSKVRCEFDFGAALWPAHVDRGQIGQVVHNLIINASQAMPDGGLVRIALVNDEVQAGRAGLAPGRYVRLSISDNGQGIAPENLSRIFEPYFTTKRHGSGLGLATVYSIIKKHQGHVDVSSQLGRGTTFDIWLPAAEVHPAPGPVPAVALKPVAARVLFMDDEPSIRSLGAAVLRRMQLEPTAVADGAAVLEEYARAKESGRPFDLVILDLTVPGGMGGAEAMAKLRAIDPQVRAIVSSGYSKDPVMARFQDYGFRARVPKPYEASELMAAVRSVLQAQA